MPTPYDDFLALVLNPPSAYGRLTWDGHIADFSPARQFTTAALARRYLELLTEPERAMVIIEVLFSGPHRPPRVLILPRGVAGGIVRLRLTTDRLRELGEDTPISEDDSPLDLG